MTTTSAPQASAPTQDVPDRSHAIFLCEGRPRIFGTFENKGITLSDRRLCWSYNGLPRERSFSEIDLIRLQRTYVFRSGNIGRCTIAFRDGLTLILVGSNARGVADEYCAWAYAEFARDLHARLAAQTLPTIRYHTAPSDARRFFALALFAISFALLVGLPLLLLLRDRSLDKLGLLFAGIVLVWRVWGIVQQNKPRAYRPSRVPHELLP